MPWITTNDGYIFYKAGGMTITNDQSQKKLTLYPPTKPFIDIETPICVGKEYGEDMFYTTVLPLLTIETTLTLKDID
jgi:hypothetical protein